tara:strand:+ start:143 stop:721 length:579 start_codon:yes stop_codon:yes gene_type:complete
MAKKSLYVNFATTEGVANYAWLNKPDQGNEFSDNKFKVTVAWNKDDPMVSKLQAIVADAGTREFGETLPSSFNNPLKDGDAGDKEQFKGKVYATFKSTRRPGQVDAKNFELPEDVIIMGGDKVRVAAAAKAYNGAQKGVSFYLDMVKLIEKQNTGGSSASSLFGDDEGYVIGDQAEAVSQEVPSNDIDIDDL